ncbi:uncharacterized protein PRCAT00004520001 [Priceomyces carsonii]|uniref:uncharacterized protein n=1 Tax=Priceomyces carsonii TaxID=28549 RepID=UPI002ED89A94|nr:unnamed protein product [Priceomyces carsonii]
MSVKQELRKTCLRAKHMDGLSKFTYKDLIMLDNQKSSYLSPLAVIGLIDLNAFFAQVEQIRLGLNDDIPVVCAQWLSLIAVSYPARKFGINRMDNILSAKKKCPDLVVAHAAVFKKGETNWAYVKGLPQQATHKVSLDPYRRESRKIIKVCQQFCDLVEKASVDECYLDFGRLIYHKLIEFFPYLKDGDPSLQLPSVPEDIPDHIYWKGELVGDDITSETETEDVNHTSNVRDWDDICMLVGSQLLFEIRSEIYKELGYKTSGGLARCKQIAKLAGGLYKPDNQTVVRNNFIQMFLEKFQLTDITGMGGKTGDIVTQKLLVPLDVSSASFIRENYDLNALKAKFKEDLNLAEKIYEIVRGNYRQALTSRVDVQSMMSRKNFTFKVDRFSDAQDWLNVFVGDLCNRLIDLDDENMNVSILQRTSNPVLKRPKTMNIHVTSSSHGSHSKQTSLPLTLSLQKLRPIMESTAKKLLLDCFGSVIENDKIYPISSLSLIISKFVATKELNMIDLYVERNSARNQKLDDDYQTNGPPNLIKNSELTAPIGRANDDYLGKLFEEFNQSELHCTSPVSMSGKSAKSTGVNSIGKPLQKEEKEYITLLFNKFEVESSSNAAEDSLKRRKNKRSSLELPDNKRVKQSLLDVLIEKKECPYCKVPVEDVFEHNDFHIAMDLSDKLNGKNSTSLLDSERPTKRSMHKGQSKLGF